MIIALLAFLGLIAGRIIYENTKEEYKQGLKYFKLMERILVGLIAVFLLAGNLSLMIFLYILIGIIIGVFLREVYFYLGIGMLSSLSLNNNFIFLISFLVFFFGIVHGTILKINFRRIGTKALFFFIPFLFLLIQSFINTNLSIFLGISIGGLLAQLGRASGS